MADLYHLLSALTKKMILFKELKRELDFHISEIEDCFQMLEALKEDQPLPTSLSIIYGCNEPCIEEFVSRVRKTLYEFSKATKTKSSLSNKKRVRCIQAVVEDRCRLLLKTRHSVVGVLDGNVIPTSPIFIFDQLKLLGDKMHLLLNCKDSQSKRQLRFSIEDQSDLIDMALKEGQLPLCLANVIDDEVVFAHLPAKRRRVLAQDDDPTPYSTLGGTLMAATASSMADDLPFDPLDHYMWEMRDKIHLFFEDAVDLGMDERNFYRIQGVIEDGFDYLKTGLLPATVVGGVKEPRYLLISSGCAICLLDLKQKKEEPFCSADFVQPLATLKLTEGQLPVSVGLFRLGSDAYMIGGHTFTSNVKSRLICEVYKSLIRSQPLKGTSHDVYCLTVEDGTTLSASKCNIKELHSPKFWPIVDEIDGQINVYDSQPTRSCHPADDWVFSHEVLEHDRRSWSVIPTTEVNLGFRNHEVLKHSRSWVEILATGVNLGFPKCFIRARVVLDNNIYAVAGQVCLLFDWKIKEWKVVDPKRGSKKGWEGVESVWDLLLSYQFIGKVGEIGFDPDRLYVILAFVRTKWGTTLAVAYIVTRTGQVVCAQLLPYFFGIRSEPSPCSVKAATVVKADEEGKTMCAILNAFAERQESGDCYLFIYTFTVKALSGVASELIAKQQIRGRELVRVDVKNAYVVKTNPGFDYDDEAADSSSRSQASSQFVGIQACFLD